MDPPKARSDSADNYGLKDAIVNLNIQTQEISRSQYRSIGSTVFWWGWLLLSIAWFGFEGGSDIYEYYQEPVMSEIAEDYHMNLQFPHISVCSSIPFTTKAKEALGITDPDEFLLLYSTLSLYPPYFPETPSNGTSWQPLTTALGSKLKAAGTTARDIISQNSLTLNGSIDGCYLRGEELNCALHSDYNLFLGMAQCFFFFGTHPIYQTMHGIRGALLLKMSNRESPMEFIRQNGLPISWNVWLIASYTNESSGHTYPLTIPTGRHAYIRIVKWVHKRLNRRSNPCLASVDQKDSVDFCIWKCEAIAAMKQCGCVRYGTEIYNPTMKICNPGNETICAYNVAKNFTCEDCQRKTYCVSVEYRPETTLRQKLPVGETAVEIYYEKLSTTVVSQRYAMTVSKILGTFGGQASLLLGVRLASFVQLAYYGVQKWCNYASLNAIRRRLATPAK